MARVLDVLTAAVLTVTLVIAAMLVWERRSGGEGEAAVPVDNWAELSSVGNRVGAEDAPVTIVEFIDYECPACRSISSAISRISDRFGEDLAIVYRHWPLDIHPAALPGALAVECAARQGHFEPFHDIMLSRGEWIVNLDFESLAREVGMPDLDAFNACVDERRTEAVVQRDVDAAIEMNARGTPSFVVNGLYLGPTQSEEDLVARVEEALEGG